MSAEIPACADVPPAVVKRLAEVALAHPEVRAHWHCEFAMVTIAADGVSASSEPWKCEVHVTRLAYAWARAASMRAAFVAAAGRALGEGERGAASHDYWAGVARQDGLAGGRTEAEHLAAAKAHREGAAALMAVLGQLDELWPEAAA